MQTIRELCGYVMGLAFCVAAVIMCGVAWIGLEDMFGWRWALGIVALGLASRINFPVVLGLYFYANRVMGWPELDSAAFAIPGLLIILPSVALHVFGVFVSTTARR